MSLREDLTSLAMYADVEIRELVHQIRRGRPLTNDLGLPLARLQLQRAMLWAEIEMMED